MQDGESNFPLLLLPENAKKHVLRTMDVDFLLSLSFCSKRTKHIVQSLKLKFEHFKMDLLGKTKLMINFRSTTILLVFNALYGDKAWKDVFRTVVSTGPPNARYYNTNFFKSFGWERKELAVEDTIYHIFDILNTNVIDVFLDCNNRNMFFFEKLSQTFRERNVRRISLGSMQNPIFNSFSYLENSLRNQFLELEGLAYLRELYRTLQEEHKILIQNFNYLNPNLPSTGKMTLNELLLINSSHITLTFNEMALNEKSLNIFLKHWINGSNKKLDYMYLSGFTQLGETSVAIEAILKRIVHKEASHDRLFKKFYDPGSNGNIGDNSSSLKHGFDIISNDGTPATASIRISEGVIYFQMKVWDQ
ncbi:F-box domain-containing protein [Caenorhabditis elegans]|uniref:F-box domain-containing protein n=1 Tax=Caenorhabditis elegans TaxID=6239 RepID=Q20182_CAEEL|nr:F-box domain-containing protein [Caenorhabditis elegans]CAB01176.1 F-box domain-containing protein [Caenorhabditis elegans]|eukprot:NP_502240.1 F-box B protein [Caenorhabditis elegans]